MRRPVVWVGRALLYSVLALLLLEGLVATVRGTRASAVSAPHGSNFPTEQASAFAREFALSYLTYSANAPSAWADGLAGFAPRSSSAQSDGWDNAGDQRAIAAESWGLTQHSVSSASVEVGVLVEPKAGPEHWVYLEVPVVTGTGGLAVDSTPVFVGGPAQATIPVPPPFNSEPGLSNQLQGMVSAFFNAYGSSNTAALSYFLAPGTSVTSLGGTLRFSSLSSLSVRASPSATHEAVAVVVWDDPASGASLTQDYSLALTEIGGRWYVAGMGAVRPSLLGGAV